MNCVGMYNTPLELKHEHSMNQILDFQVLCESADLSEGCEK